MLIMLFLQYELYNCLFTNDIFSILLQREWFRMEILLAKRMAPFDIFPFTKGFDCPSELPFCITLTFIHMLRKFLFGHEPNCPLIWPLAEGTDAFSNIIANDQDDHPEPPFCKEKRFLQIIQMVLRSQPLKKRSIIAVASNPDFPPGPAALCK